MTTLGNQFDTAVYTEQFTGLHRTMARVTFPAPFTIGDYRKWFRAMNLAELPDETDDVDQVVLLRQYRAAMAVVKVEPYNGDELELEFVAGAVDEGAHGGVFFAG